MLMGRISDPFYLIAGRLLFKPIVMIALFLGFAFEGYRIWGSDDSNVGYMRQRLADSVCTEAVKDLPQRPGLQSIAVLDLAGDATGTVSAALRSRIGALGTYRLLDESFFRKLMNMKIRFTLQNALTGLVAGWLVTVGFNYIWQKVIPIEENRGFKLKDLDARSLERMADAWDALRVGKEANWWPIPPSW